MKNIEKLIRYANRLDALGKKSEADKIDQKLETFAKDKKWMQKAVNPKEKGELHKKLNIPEDKKIPTSLLKKKKKELQEKAEGDKKLSKSDRELLSQIIFALNARK